MIETRELRSGDRITTMEELRTQTGYGRATIGETARLLAERGSVEVRPGRGGGLFVAQVSPAVRLRQTLLTVPQGATTVADAIAVRDSLEELIALDAAAHRTDQDVADLERLLDAMREAEDDLEQFLGANWALHERIAAIGPNQLARAVYLGVTRCIAELSVKAEPEADSTPGDYLNRRMAVHEELVAAIRLGDPQRARAAVGAHRGENAGAHHGEPATATVAATGTATGTAHPAERADTPNDRPLTDSDTATSERERITALERENRELRQAANTLLKSASAFFETRS